MRSTERVPADARHELRGPRRPALPRQALPAHEQQRVQPVARRRPHRQARRSARRSSCCARGWRTSRGSSAPTSTCSTRSPRAAATSVSTNHYYLGRKLAEDPDFPVAPAWPDQDGAGAHTNLSGVGLVKGTEHRDAAVRADGVPDGAGGAERSSRTASSRPTPTSRRPSTSATGPRSSWTRSTSNAPGRRCARPWPSCNASGGSSGRARGRGVAGLAEHARRAARRRPAARAARVVPGRRRARSARSPRASCRRRCSRASCSGAGVGVGTLLLGGGLAALVSFYDFPGRRWLDWALVLPLAMPALRARVRPARPVRRGEPAAARRPFGCSASDCPSIRTTAGAITVLTLVLYPYVYTLGRSAFLGQSRQSLEAARTLGLTLRAGGAPRGAAAGPSRARRRRRAGGDGGAGRLRRRQPARLPRADRRDLPRLVRRLRPGRGPAAGDGAGRPGATLVVARAAAARARPLQPGARSRRRRDPAPAARAGALGGRRRCRRVLLAVVVRLPGGAAASCGRPSRVADGASATDLARAAVNSLLLAGDRRRARGDRGDRGRLRRRARHPAARDRAPSA